MAGVRGAMGLAGGAIAGVGRMARRAAFPLAILAGASAKAAVDFQQAMELIHTQAGASQAEVTRLSGAVLQLAKVSPQGPTQLANALYRLEGAGIRGSKAMDALKAASDLAAVGNANVEDTAKTLSQAWFSGIKGAHNFKSVVAELNATVGAGDLRLNQLVDALGVGILPVARQAGLHFRDITGVLSVFGDETNNVSGWTAQLATALHFLYNPTTKAEKALNRIGLSGNRLGGDMRKKNGLLTALTDLRSHLAKMKGGARGLPATQTLGQILPGGRGRVLAVLLNQLDRYRAKLKQVGATTGNWADAVAKTHETAAFRLHTAWSKIQATAVQLGGHVLPLLVPAAEAVASGVDKIANAMERVGHSKAAASVSAFLSAAVKGGGTRGGRGPGKFDRHHDSPSTPPGPPAKQSGMAKAGLALRGAIAPVVSWVGQMLPKVGGALVKVGAQLVAAFKPAMPFFTNVLLPVLKGVAMGVLGGVVAAFNVLVPVIKIVAGALGFVGNVLSPLKGVFQAVGMVIGFVFGGAILHVLGLIGKVGGVFRLLAVPIDLAAGAFGFVARNVGRLFGFFGRLLTGVQRFVGTFSSMPARVITSALNLVGGIITTLGSLPGRMAGFAMRAGGRFIRGLGSAIRSGFNSILSIASRLGKSVLSAVVDAIKGAPSAIVNALLNLVPGPVKGVVKGALGLVGMATGGTVRRGGAAIVGERGPELATFPRGTTVYDHHQTRRAMTGRSSARHRVMVAAAPVYVTANLHLSGKQIHSEVFRVDRLLHEAT